MKFSTKKFLKRFGRGFLIFFVLLIALIIAIPYFFKDQIMAKVKTEINNNVNAEVDFKNVGLNLWRSFPDFTLRLSEFSVDGKDEFKGIRLADVKNFDVTLDLMSIINGEKIEIEGVNLNDPTLYVKVLKNGKANYDIAIPSTDTTTTQDSAGLTEFNIELDRYAITNGNVVYDDASTGVFVDIENLNHSGRGNFTATVYDLVTKTKADAFTVNFGGIPYLNNTKTNIDLTLNMDMAQSKYTVKNSKIQLNALVLKLMGYVAMPANGIDLDLNFNSPQTRFKDLLSMIPAAFTEDFGSVKANGKMALKGSVKGLFNDNSMPAIDIDLGVTNGSFQYPDLPIGIEDINTKVTVKSPNKNFDNLVVNVPNFHIKLDKNPFDAKFLLKTPLSDPYVEAAVDGLIDLGKLAKAFPMEGVKQLDGLIKADVTAKMSMSQVEKEQYEQLNMAGAMTVKDMHYHAEGLPMVNIKNLEAEFSPKKVQLANFDAKLGQSDIQASGSVDNILAFFSDAMTMKGNLVVRSNTFNANEWMQGGASESKVQHADDDAKPAEPASGAEEVELFENFAFSVDGQVNNIIFEDYELKNAVAKGTFTPALFNLDIFKINIGKSDIEGTGKVENVFGYLFDGELIKGNLAVKSDLFDLNDLMAMAGVSDESETKANQGGSGGSNPKSDEPVFGRFDIDANVDAKRIFYATYDLSDLKVKGNLGHQVFKVENFSTQFGNSDLSGSGRIENALNYVFKDNEKVKGKINIKSKFFDLNQFMIPEPPKVQPELDVKVGPVKLPPKPKAQEPVPTENLEPILVPDDFEFDITADMGKILFNKMELKNVKGALDLKDMKVALKDVHANLLGGAMKMNGSYDTKDKDNPKFDFGYNIASFNVGKAFQVLSTVKALAPIAQYVDGNFSSDLKLSGVLGKDMMPDWKKLNGEGFLETVEAMVKDFKPVKEIAKKLNIKQLNPFEIKDTKNWFEIKDGQVEIKPFKLKFKDIDMEISGFHGVAQDIDYKIKTKIPRALFEKNAGTAVIGQGLDMLSSQASKLGLNFAQGDYLNLDLNLGGRINKPSVKVKFLGASGKSTTVKDVVKDKAKEEAEKLKQKAAEEAKKQKEELERKAKEEAEKLRKKAEEEAAKKQKELEEKLKKEAEELKRKAKEEAERKAKELEEKIGKEAAEKARKKAEEELNKKIDEETKEKLKKEAEKLKDKFKIKNPFGNDG